MTNVPMERYFLDMPYETLFEIFRQTSRGKLFEISRFSSKFGNVARDTRLWKDVYIKYEPYEKLENTSGLKKSYYTFDELYSGPFPVKGIDLSNALIKPPVSFETDQIVKVTELNWSPITAEKVLVEALLAKYQCTKLYLDKITVRPRGHIISIAPEAFSKQTALEVLSLNCTLCRHIPTRAVTRLQISQWLVTVLTVLSKYCKNLKSLDLSYNELTNLDEVFVESLPTTLEKLYVHSWTLPTDFFFELLAKRLPNLKEIGLCPETVVECPNLLKFKCLEALHIIRIDDQNIRDLYEYLIRFPALKNVHLKINEDYYSKRNFETLRTKLEPHGIATVRITGTPEYPEDDNLWLVSGPRAM